MNLLIFLDLMQMLLSLMAKYLNFFLFLSIFLANFSWFYHIRRADVYLVSNWSCPTTLGRCGKKSPSYLWFKDYNDGVSTFRNCPVKVYTVHWIFFSAGSFLFNLSDVSLPKLGLHWENCEERTKKTSLKNNDDLMHPYKAIIVVRSSRKMLMLFQTRNYHIRFAWNSCPGPLIRNTRHFQ